MVVMVNLKKKNIQFLNRFKLKAFHFLPNDIISDLMKLKSFADNKISVIMIFKFVFDRVENIVAKEEYTGYQHFLLLPQCSFSSKSLTLYLTTQSLNSPETQSVWKPSGKWQKCR